MSSTSYGLRRSSPIARAFASFVAAFGAFFDEIAEVTARNGNIEPFGL